MTHEDFVQIQMLSRLNPSDIKSFDELVDIDDMPTPSDSSIDDELNHASEEAEG